VIPARVRLVLVCAVLAVATATGAFTLTRGFRTQASVANEARLFDQVLRHVAENYVDSIDVGDLYRQAAAGLVSELGDAHSVFLDSTRLARVQASITGLIGILGLEVDARDGWVNVVAAIPGAPAEQAGLRTGDRIAAIDGRVTRDWTTDETRRALRGAPGTSVRLSIVRPGVAGATDIVLHREAIYVRPVQRAMILAPGIRYVTLRTFSDSAALELSEAIDSLYKSGVRRLIFDLRGNPGGLLAQGRAVADLFLNPGQTIVTLKGRALDSRREYIDEQPQKWPDLKLAVLVNRGTASASEIVAGALQDHDRAIVIGRRTYGKGSAQSVFSFHDAAGVKLTTARWYTPVGRNIDLIPETSPNAAGDSTDRPVFKTDSGRTVYGGGGIVPDVIAGDSVNVPRAALFAALGPRFRAFMEAMAAEAAVIAKRGVSNPMFNVTPEMRNALFARLQSSGPQVSRQVFDEASEWIDSQLGLEITRRAFDRPTEWRRSVIRDPVVIEAMERLR
jgi:carboxyl-terminal processing protease